MRLIGAVVLALAAMPLAFAQPAKQAQGAKEAPKQAQQGRKDAGSAKAEKKDTKGTKKAAPKANPIAESYNAIPLAERMSIQSDLVWTGDYNGLVNGEFGDRAIAAVKAFQKGRGAKETGVLNQPERAALSAAAKPKQEAVGWRMVDDAASGTRIGLPAKLVPQTSQVAGGTRWASSRGEYSVESFRIAQSGTTLAATFERMKKEPAGRKAEYSVMRDNFFVISGLQNLKKFYVRAQARGEEVRGVTVLYDQAMAGIMEPVVVAMSSAFLAFPGGPAAPAPRRKVEYASGVVVAPGHIVTSREALDGCYVVTVAGVGGADRVAEDKTNGLVLLRVHGSELKPVALGAAASRGVDVSLLGVADPQAQGGGGAVSAAKARVSDSLALEPAPSLGFDGAAALDAEGKLAGIAALKVAAATPPATSAALTPVEAVRAMLDAQKVAPASASVTGPEASKGSVVRVICVRK